MLTIKAKVSIIIPNWNGSQVIVPCIKALKNQIYHDFEIIIVDNGSTDDSIRKVTKLYSDVQVVYLKYNMGFAKAVNEGILRANGEYIVLLNNDTIATNSWLDELVGFLERNPNVCFAVSKMLDYYNHQIIDSCGDAYLAGGKAVRIGNGKKDGLFFKQPYEVFGASAAASIYRRSSLIAVGLFDDDYFSYYEDVDISCRLRLSGYTCFFVPSAIIYHIRGHTGGKISKLVAFWVVRNCFITIIKDLPSAHMRHNWFKIATTLIRMISYYAIHGVGPAAFRGLVSGLICMPVTLHKRQTIQKARRITDVEWSNLIGASENIVHHISTLA